MSEPVFQSGLPDLRVGRNVADKDYLTQPLELAKVLKVHSKRFTADIQLINSNNSFVSQNSNEGTFGAMICVPDAGIDQVTGKPYGTVPRIQPGTIVLVGFLDGNTNPVIISPVIYNGEEFGEANHKNVLPNTFTPQIDNMISTSYSRSVSANQVVSEEDSYGNTFKSYPNGAYLRMSDTGIDDNVSEKIQSESGNQGRGTARPRNISGGMCSSNGDWIKFLARPKTTSVRASKIQTSDNKCSYVEIDKDGSVRIRRQLDTKMMDCSTELPKKYSEAVVCSDGTITASFTDGTNTHTFIIHPDETGISVTTTGPVNVTSDKEINMKAKTLNIEADTNIKGEVNITGVEYINGKRSIVVGDVCTHGYSHT